MILGMNKVLNYRAMERIVKGYANHRRLRMLELLAREPGLTIDDFCKRLRSGYVTTSDHLRKMSAAGLIYKRNDGAYIRHALTLRGKTILSFCKNIK